MRHKETVGLILFAAIMVSLTAFWTTTNPFPGDHGDSYAYLTGLLTFVDGLPADLFERPMGLLAETAHGGRPPLYQILAAPFVLLFGRSESAALAVNGLLYLALIFSVYRIGLFLKNETVGLLAAFLTATYPPVIHLSHTFLPVFGLVACGAFSVWRLLVLVNSRTVKSAWAFGASIAVGLLVHPNFVWTGGVLALFAVAAAFRAEPGTGLRRWGKWPGQSRFLLLGLVPSAAVFLTIAGSWYLEHGQYLFTLYQGVSEGSELRQSEIVTVGFPQVEGSSLWYTQTAPLALSNVLVLLFIVGAIAALFSRRLDQWILVATVTTSFILLSLQSTFHWMYVVQVLPVVAVLSTAWIVDIRPRWLARSLSLLCLVVGSVNLTVGTFGVRPWVRPVAAYLSVCPEEGYRSFCPRPGSPDERKLRMGDLPEREILAAVLEDPDCRGSKPCVLAEVNTGRPPRLNYYRVKYWPDLQLGLTGTWSNIWGEPFNFSALLNSDYVVYPTKPFWETAWWGLYHTAAVHFLHSPPPEFAEAHRLVSEFEGHHGITIRLLKRVKPLTEAEAQASISAVNLPEQYKTQRHELLVSLYRKEGRLEKAVELCGSEAQTHLSRVALAVCSSAGVDRAIALKSEGKRAEAMAELRAAMQRAPENSLPVRLLADFHRERGENDEALRLYQQALQINPVDLAARMHLAILYHWNLRDAERAIEQLNKARSLFPDTAWPLRVRADIERERRKSHEALRLYREVLRISPDDLAARVHLAILYQWSLGSSEKAIEELNEARSRFPDTAWPLRVRADICREAGESDEALRLYQEALRIDPRDLNSRVSLATVYRNLSRFERAIEELNEASSLFPEMSWPLRVLADTYWEMGDEKLALAYGTRAVQVMPEDVDARYLLGRIYERSGRQEEARRVYRDVLVIDPDYRAAKTALSRLLKPK